jgi:hypothetical protein
MPTLRSISSVQSKISGNILLSFLIPYYLIPLFIYSVVLLLDMLVTSCGLVHHNNLEKTHSTLTLSDCLFFFFEYSSINLGLTESEFLSMHNI